MAFIPTSTFDPLSPINSQCPRQPNPNLASSIRFVYRKLDMDEINERLIKGKERIAGVGRNKPRVVSSSRSRLPPGQHEVEDWPVLDLGIQPEIPLDKWALNIEGLVENPKQLTWQDFMALPQVDKIADFHCVTTWSRFNNHWQ